MKVCAYVQDGRFLQKCISKCDKTAGICDKKGVPETRYALLLSQLYNLQPDQT